MRCRTCKLEKPNEQFSWLNKATNRRHTACRVCYNKNALAWRNKNLDQCRKADRVRHKERARLIAEFVWNYKLEHPCKCGESDPIVLDFDHTSNKKFGIAQARHSNRSIEQLKLEIQKCVVRCANCHRRKTAKEQSWWRP